MRSVHIQPRLNVILLALVLGSLPGCADEVEEECQYGGRYPSCNSDPSCDEPTESYPEGHWCNPRYDEYDTWGDDSDTTDAPLCDPIRAFDLSGEHIVTSGFGSRISGLPQVSFLMRFRKRHGQIFDVELQSMNGEECLWEEGCDDFEPRKVDETVHVIRDLSVGPFNNIAFEIAATIPVTEENAPGFSADKTLESITVTFSLTACANGAFCGQGRMTLQGTDWDLEVPTGVGSVRVPEEDTVYDPESLPVTCEESTAAALEVMP